VGVAGGGTLAPGGLSGPGTLTLTSSLTFETGSVCSMRIAGVFPGQHDAMTVAGAITLNGASLSLNETAQGAPPDLDTIVWLIDNTGADPVNGTFAGLPEGSLVSLQSRFWRLTYSADFESGAPAGGNDTALLVRTSGTTVIIR
jgi:hypothetical protein